MQVLILRQVEAVTPVTSWFLIFVAVIVTAFVLLMGALLAAALLAKTPQEQRYRIKLLREFLRFVLGLFRPGKPSDG
jgi:hypothetical protein